MENAADAIKIGFAVIVFTIAIALTFNLVSQAKATSDHILYYSDETNFYEYADSRESNRLVPVSELIAILHKYYIESIEVVVTLDDRTYIFGSENENFYTDKQKEENLEKFISENLNSDMKFTEEFVEAPISGIYQYGNDGTEVVITPGNTKIYATYTINHK